MSKKVLERPPLPGDLSEGVWTEQAVKVLRERYLLKDKEIEAGVEPQNFSKYTSIPDRREAIKMAIKFAEPKDIVLVAGKGHDKRCQEINGVKHHFDDKETIIELYKLMSK